MITWSPLPQTEVAVEVLTLMGVGGGAIVGVGGDESIFGDGKRRRRGDSLKVVTRRGAAEEDC